MEGVASVYINFSIEFQGIRIEGVALNHSVHNNFIQNKFNSSISIPNH